MAQRSFYVRKTLSVRVWFCKNSEESSLFCFYLNFQSNSVEKVWIKGSLWALLFFFFFNTVINANSGIRSCKPVLFNPQTAKHLCWDKEAIRIFISFIDLPMSSQTVQLLTLLCIWGWFAFSSEIACRKGHIVLSAMLESWRQAEPKQWPWWCLEGALAVLGAAGIVRAHKGYCKHRHLRSLLCIGNFILLIADCVLHCAQRYWKRLEVLLVEDTKYLIRWGGWAS